MLLSKNKKSNGKSIKKYLKTVLKLHVYLAVDYADTIAA